MNLTEFRFVKNMHKKQKRKKLKTPILIFKISKFYKKFSIKLGQTNNVRGNTQKSLKILENLQYFF